MEDVLPSYGDAVSRDHWRLVAPYIRLNDLHTCTLVSRQWCTIFLPYLWGNPLSIIDIETDTLYHAWNRLRKIVRWARPSTLALVHTVQFPLAEAEMYEIGGEDWLTEILKYLPRLQSLLVSRLPDFDIRALSSLIRAQQTTGTINIPTPLHSLRLLEAQACANVTPATLASTLRLLPNLIFLDLSRTQSARSVEVLSNLRFLPELRILKLARVWLNDEKLAVLADAVDQRLLFLDLSDSVITDTGVECLVDKCLRSQSSLDNESLHNRTHKTFRTIANQDFDNRIGSKLTSSFAQHLGLADNGLTHLKLSRCAITSVGISQLLNTGSLHVLDVGGSLLGPAQRQDEVEAQRRLSELLDQRVTCLEYFRVTAEIIISDHFHTLLTRQRDALQSVGISASHGAKLQHRDSFGSREQMSSSQSTGKDEASRQNHGAQVTNSSQIDIKSKQCDPVHSKEDNASSREPSIKHGICPAFLTNLHTLILTNVPKTTQSPHIPQRLLSLIKLCANLEAWSINQAVSTYELPPGHDQQQARKAYAQNLFPLRKIVLEMTNIDDNKQAATKRSISSRQPQMLSSTLDRDCEAYLDAAKDDFSFFESEKPQMVVADLRRDGDVVQKGKEKAVYDVLGAIAEFRRTTKAKHEAALARGSNETVDGYWSGVIEVVRSTK